MADAVDRPKDDGRIRLPPVTGSMNRIAPKAIRGGKGSKDDDKNARLGREDDDEQKIVLEAKKYIEFSAGEESENRKSGVDDLRFKTGEGQWPPEVAAQRNFDKRPMLTINQLPTLSNQVTNDIRQNRPAVHYSPTGDRADKETAKMIDGMFRQSWRVSNGDISLDTAIDNAASAPGWGFIRVGTRYESNDSFDQEITFERVVNPFSVYSDPRCTSPTGEGQRRLAITEDVDRETFKNQWPDADQMAWTTYGIGDPSRGGWNSEKTIRVAEYFKVDTEIRTLLQLSTGHVGFEDELADEIWDQINSGKIDILNERESECDKVLYYKVTATEVLEEQEWPGSHIPMVKFIGNEIWVENKVRLSGIIRNAKQPQLMSNYMKTLLVETIAQQPKISWLIAEGQDEGYEQQWETGHVTARPALKYRPLALGDKQVPPPQRQAPFGVPAGIVQAVADAQQDMMATTGIRFNATLGDHVYDESGRALRELRERGDMGSFHYIDNAARSLRYLGEIYKDLLPKVYDTRRIVTILREDDKEEQAVIDPAAPKAFAEMPREGGKKIKVFNPTVGKYGVAVTIGPSYATKRIEASESMMDFVRAIAPAAPQIAIGVADLVAKNLDWPGGEEFASRIAKIVAQAMPGVITPDMKDVPPQVQAVVQSLQQQAQKLQQELVVTQRQLVEKQTDQAIKLEQIEKAFEAKLLQVAQKSDADQMKHIGSSLRDIIQEVTELREALSKPPET